jgi:peptidyl-tRNA hydrolase
VSSCAACRGKLSKHTCDKEAYVKAKVLAKQAHEAKEWTDEREKKAALRATQKGGSV